MWYGRGRRSGRGRGRGFGRGYGPWPRPWCPWYNWYVGNYGYQNNVFGRGWGYRNWQANKMIANNVSVNYPTVPQRQPLSSIESTVSDISKRVKDILSNAILGQNVMSPYGTTNIPIIHNGTVVGWLWENVPLKNLDAGEQWYTGRGLRVTLLYKGKPVGYLWV